MRVRAIIVISVIVVMFFLLLNYTVSGALPLDHWLVESVTSVSEGRVSFISISIKNTGLTPSVINSIYFDGKQCSVPRDVPIYEISCDGDKSIVILISEYSEVLEHYPSLTGTPTTSKIWPGGRILLRIILYKDRNPELAQITEIRIRTLSGKTLTINYRHGLSVTWSS